MARVERLLAEQRAGLTPRPENLDPVEWELYLLWVGREAEHEAAARSSLHKLSTDVHALIGAFTTKK